MADRNASAAPIFSATLIPHRSLPPAGFAALMAAVGAAWFGTGIAFYLAGAWPVLGFFGLDFLLLWLAFHLNYRAGRAQEEVWLSREALIIRKLSPSGRASEVRFNPSWVRLEMTELDDEGVVRIDVCSRAERVPVGTFLNPGDRTSFARAFSAALAEARASF
jgi:uncharacterized membrane protein